MARLLLCFAAISIGVRGLNIHLDVSNAGDVGLDVTTTNNRLKDLQGNDRARHPSASSRSAHILESEEDRYLFEFWHGKHQGFLSEDKSYIIWKNIPYATAPNDEFTRWVRPYPPTYTEDKIFYGNETSGKCPQVNPGWVNHAQRFLADFGDKNLKSLSSEWDNEIKPEDYGSAGELVGSEDCLYLDVFVPVKVFEQRHARSLFKAATVVWIHGGGFVFGSKDDFGGPDGLLKTANITTDKDEFIMVAINYRLGMFGWMGGREYRKEYGTINLGLEDQKFAIDWVADNIHRFGGDGSRRIHLMGESAGAASILHHITYAGGNKRVYSPRWKGAIIQSPAFFPQPNTEPLDLVYKDILKRADVKSLDDLANVTTNKLLEINRDVIHKSPYGQFTFGPTINSTETPDLPGKLLKAGNFHGDIGVLTGHTTVDGLLFTPPWLRNQSALVDFFTKLYPRSSQAVVDEIKKYKFWPGGKDGLSQRLSIMSISNLLDDVAIQCNSHYLSEALLKDTQLYSRQLYRYTFGAPSPAPLHGADLDYTFYPNDAMPGMGPADPKLATEFQKYWVNKIRWFDPNDEPEPEKETWPKYKADNRTVMEFGHFLKGVIPKSDFEMTLTQDKLDAKKCEFWQDALYGGGAAAASAGRGGTSEQIPMSNVDL